MDTTNRQHLFPVVLGAVLIMLMGLWAASELLKAFSQKVKERHGKAYLVADHVEVGLRSLALSPGLGPEDVARYFSDLERLTGARCSLYGKDGSLLASSDPSPQTPPPGDSGCQAQGGGLIVWRVLRDPPAGADPSAWPLRLVARVDASWRTRENSGAEGGSLLLGLVLGCCGMTLLALAWSYSIRNRNLKLKLDAAKEREEHIEELSLAAAGLAHETKNPLGIIRGLAQRVAEEDIAPEEVRDMARDIMEEADITTARLGDFMCYAKIREPEMAPVDTRAVVQRMTALLSRDFDDAGVSLEAKADDIKVLADSEMLSQALMNLLLNSLRATDKGGKVVLSVRKVSHSEAFVSVSDTGRGIPPELLPNIFKPYTARKAHGYGIGLAIVSKIVERSGWTISVESRLGEGTAITIEGVRLAT